MNIRGFQGFRQDKGEVRTATGAACRSLADIFWCPLFP